MVLFFSLRATHVHCLGTYTLYHERRNLGRTGCKIALLQLTKLPVLLIRVPPKGVCLPHFLNASYVPAL